MVVFMGARDRDLNASVCWRAFSAVHQQSLYFYLLKEPVFSS